MWFIIILRENMTASNGETMKRNLNFGAKEKPATQ